jgi:hypothetical protein
MLEQETAGVPGMEYSFRREMDIAGVFGSVKHKPLRRSSGMPELTRGRMP